MRYSEYKELVGKEMPGLAPSLEMKTPLEALRTVAEIMFICNVCDSKLAEVTRKQLATYYEFNYFTFKE